MILTFDEYDPVLLAQEEGEKSIRESLRQKGVINSYYELLCDKEKIQDLATKGDQPLMQILNRHFRVIYVKEELNFFQNEYLVNFLYKYEKKITKN